MKKVSKVIVVLLTLAMALSICACGGGDDNGKALVGTWGLEYDLSGMLAGEMGEEYADFTSPLEMSICFEFKEDGTFAMFGEEESFKANFATWLDEFVTFSSEIVYKEFDAQGLSREEADANFQEQQNTTIPEYLRSMFEASVDVDALLAEMAINGTYETSGDKLYMAEDGESIDKNAYDVFTVDGNNLKLELPAGVDASEGEILPGLSYPLEFTKRN